MTESTKQPKAKHAKQAEAADPDASGAGAAGGAVAVERTDPAKTGDQEVTTESIVESLLMSTDVALPASKIAQLLGIGDASDVKRHIETLNQQYEETGASFRIQAIAKGYQVLTLPVYDTWVQKLHKARAESEVDGPLNASVQNSFMQLTSYSPQPKITTKLQELRIYQAVPGKLPALNARFADHTTHLFEKHGIKNVGYWTQDVGTNNQLFYMVGHDSLADREKNFAAFGADPDWQKAKAESERNGPLTVKTHSSILQPTAYSPR